MRMGLFPDVVRAQFDTTPIYQTVANQGRRPTLRVGAAGGQDSRRLTESADNDLHRLPGAVSSFAHVVPVARIPVDRHWLPCYEFNQT